MPSTFLPTRARLALALLCLPALADAALSLDATTRLALQQAPALAAQQDNLAGAEAARSAADALPDPRLAVGVDNLPISGMDRFSLTRDFMTMQRIVLMQEVPNGAKRAARAEAALARIERERALLGATAQAVRRDAALAWLGVYYAERRALQLGGLEHELRMLLDTVGARVAAGKAMPAERTMAQQELLALADRRDDAQRDVTRARAALRRWVGMRADDALEGEPPTIALRPDELRRDMHRHAELEPYVAQQAVARAEVAEADAEGRGDWSWEVGYSRRGPQYGDMVSLQVSFDLPWQTGRRQQPLAAAKRLEAQRIEAERDDMTRRHAEELEAQLAELQALDAQRARLDQQGLALADERVALALAGYESGRAELGGVLQARREALEARLRGTELDAQRAALRVRLSTLIAER